MRAGVAINAKRSVVEAYFTKDSRIEKRVDCLVDSCERDGRDFLAHSLENFLGTRMARHGSQRLKHNLTLMGDGQTVLLANLSKLRNGSDLHLLRSQWMPEIRKG